MDQAVKWKANHDSVVKTKRRSEARLRIALAGLQEAYDLCGENMYLDSDASLALSLVRQAVKDAFEKATSP